MSVTFDESILSSSVVAADLGISGTCTVLPTASVTSVDFTVGGTRNTLPTHSVTAISGQLAVIGLTK